MTPYWTSHDGRHVLYHGDCLAVLPALAQGSVHCCVSSPPYYGLRDYGHADQIGLESTPAEYVARLVAVFREVRRCLRDDGTLWLNLGDSYAGGSQCTSSRPGAGRADGIIDQRAQRNRNGLGCVAGLKAKDLIGIPWRVAFALQADGWYLRQDIIWAKPNPMPESVTDRCTKSHEYIFMLSKSARYYYDQDAIKEPGKNPEDDIRRLNAATEKHKTMPTAEINGLRPRADKQRGRGRRHDGFNDRWDAMEKAEQCSGMRNKRSVWTVATKPYAEAHFATYPPALIQPCILAGAPAGGIILDPFNGAGTTGLVAAQKGRRYIGVELNRDYCAIAVKRMEAELAQPMLIAPTATPETQGELL